jgi:hypothetical protein
VLNSLVEIDLSNTVPKLDATATEIVAQQRDSLAQRKDLAQKTKDFRKLDDEGKLGEYKSLLKGKGRDLLATRPPYTRMLTPTNSLSVLHRPVNQPGKDFLCCILTTIFILVRSARSVSAPRGISGIISALGRNVAEVKLGKRTTTQKRQ